MEIARLKKSSFWKRTWRARVQILRASSFFSSKTTLVADLESEKWGLIVKMWLFIFFENILEKIIKLLTTQSDEEFQSQGGPGSVGL